MESSTMALCESVSNIPAEVSVTPRETGVSNDPFAFWLLPDGWKRHLSSQIDEARDAVEYYLLERYLGDGNRRPPAKIKAYYRIKQLLPAALRFRINSL